VGNLFFNKFKGIRRSNPIRPRVKVTFDTIHSTNYCLASKKLLFLMLRPLIPSTLVYFYGIINLEISVLEEYVWERLESSAKVVNFRCISTNQHSSSQTPIEMVEFKFFLPDFSEKTSIFNVIFRVFHQYIHQSLSLNAFQFNLRSMYK